MTQNDGGDMSKIVELKTRQHNHEERLMTLHNQNLRVVNEAFWNGFSSFHDILIKDARLSPEAKQVIFSVASAYRDVYENIMQQFIELHGGDDDSHS